MKTKFIKQTNIYLFEEDREILEKIEREEINYNRLIRSLLAEWFYKNQSKGESK